MKKLFAYLGAIVLLAGAAAAGVPVHAQTQTITCPPGEQVITDYTTESPTQRCDGTKSVPANTPLPTFSKPTCDQSVSGSRFIPDTVSGGGVWVCPDGSTTNVSVGSQPTYTNATPSAAATTKGALTYVPLEPIPGGDAGTYNSLERYLNLMFNILLSIGAMIAVITLVLGGITFMISEVVDKRSAAKRRIQAAFIGLGLLLTCWLILNTINPNLTKFSLPGIDQPTANGSTGGGGGASATTINTAQINQQQDACKKQPGGDMCAFNPVPGQPGQFECYCG